MLYKYPYKSELGIITLLANDHGLLGTWFENQAIYGGLFDLDNVLSGSDHQSTIIDQAIKWLDAYFAKQYLETVDFQLMPQGTAFQQDVWSELQKIPYGETITLDELGERIKARQTKGQGTVNAIIGAINSNPIAIMIPSHRILISSDQLGDHLATNYLGQLLREFESS
ncbi:methylated-DNA--[protein]-cysteine S-methyltransferase [Aerococcus urinaeequi]|uniref:Methylated-DNA--[protein]-cysteine S-methyltransferase n=1 Tax=Aerococcus urinaeequi TaxID=51665 RepID=A0AAE9XI38_9LACT|nr:methylated-DNA--[protein]-cysteine S-methyltransferase [Aerococcus urinaeequi]WCG37241.1 methylated-DNA--[protein]-cysteine S-methyltransferase [Aerococcus urinaeequi]